MAYKIAVMMNRIENNYLQEIWEGLEAAATEKQVQLFYFTGNSTENRDPADLCYNSIYGMVSRFGVDGVIVQAGSISELMEQSWFLQLLAEMGDIPILLAGMRKTHYPSVYLENSLPVGMLIDHLVQAHTCKKIAYVGGPAYSEEAVDRLTGYRNGMAKWGLSIQDDWIEVGDFTRQSGYKGIKKIWEKSIVCPEAIIVASQEMVLGVLDYCTQKKISIPDDLAVVSYDDFPEAMFFNPSLTVVQVPLRLFGMQTVERMIDIIEKKETELQILEPRMIVRGSCGCQPAARCEGQFSGIANLDFSQMIDPLFKSSDRGDSQLKLRVLESFSFLTNMAKRKQDFDFGKLFKEVQMLLSHGMGPERITGLLDIWVTWIGGETDLVERIFYAVSSILHSQVSRDDYLTHLEDLRKRTAIQNTGIRLLSSLELEELKKILHRNLPGLGISDSFIYLFDALMPYLGIGKPPRDGKLFFHQINQNAAFGIGKTDFPNQDLITRLELTDKGNYLVLPLFMDKEIFGIVGFRCQYYFFELYDNVRAYISAAVKGGTLLSEQRRSREALASSHQSVIEKSQELEIANRAKDMFLSNMSHEIRTPLNAILGFTDLLLTEEDKPEKKGYLEAILDGGRTLLGIVNTVLELSRIEAGRIEIKQQETAFKKMLDHIVNNYNSKSRNQNFQIDLEVGGAENYSLFIDETKVIRIVSSLLAAALSTNESGKVLLECRIKFTSHDRCAIEISVKNRDGSVNDDKVARVFEPFSKYGETMIVEELDTGLTLALSRKIASAMKGRLTCTVCQWPDGGRGMNFLFSMWDILYFDSSTLPEISQAVQLDIPIRENSAEALVLSDLEMEMLKEILNSYPNVKKEYFLIDDISAMTLEMTKTARRLALKGMQEYTQRLSNSCEGLDLGKIRELLTIIID